MIAALSTGLLAPLYKYVLRPYIIQPRLDRRADRVRIWDEAQRDMANRNRRIDDAIIKINTMAEALGPNGGRSLSDLIHKTAATTDRMETAIAINDIRTAELSNLMTHLLFEFCDEGLCVRASESVCRQFGYLATELAQHGWKNFIHEEDRARVIREFEYAVHERRFFGSFFRAVSKAGAIFNVHMMATPKFNETGDELLLLMARVDLLGAEKVPA